MIRSLEGPGIISEVGQKVLSTDPHSAVYSEEK